MIYYFSSPQKINYILLDILPMNYIHFFLALRYVVRGRFRPIMLKYFMCTSFFFLSAVYILCKSRLPLLFVMLSIFFAFYLNEAIFESGLTSHEIDSFYNTTAVCIGERAIFYIYLSWFEPL